MNTCAAWLADKLSLALEPHERDALRGDHAELGVTGAQGLRDVLGLVSRRQLQLWTDWRPWLTLLVLVLPLGLLLSLASQRIASSSSVPLFIYVSNWTPIFLESPGSRSDMLGYAVAIGNQYLVLACWSWAVGFLLALLSRRTIPVNGILLCLAVWSVSLLKSRLGGGALGPTYPLLLQGLFFLFPSIWGMSQGSRSATAPRSLRTLLMVPASVTIAELVLRNWGVTLCAWGSLQSCQEWAMQTGYGTRVSVPLLKHLPTLPLTLVGPLGYLLAASIWRRKRRLTEGAA